MKLKSLQQSKIDRKLQKRKEYLALYFPVCIFCGHLCKTGDLVHLIPRSWQSKNYSREELQTLPMNTWLGHRECHNIFDNHPSEALELLPFIPSAMMIIKEIDIEYYYQKLNLIKS